MKRILFFLLVLALLAGCVKGTPNITPLPEPTETPLPPTVTPEPTETPDPTPTQDTGTPLPNVTPFPTEFYSIVVCSPTRCPTIYGTFDLEKPIAVLEPDEVVTVIDIVGACWQEDGTLIPCSGGLRLAFVDCVVQREDGTQGFTPCVDMDGNQFLGLIDCFYMEGECLPFTDFCDMETGDCDLPFGDGSAPIYEGKITKQEAVG